MSHVLSISAAPPETAERHFLAKLSVETDVSDVWNDLQNEVNGFQLVDVRSEKAFQECHLPGAVSLPHPSISADTTSTLDRAKVIVVYCWSPACNGAAKGAAKLAALGYRVKEMLGGIEYWRREGHPVEGILAENAPLIG
ncbi:rhodanese-like domain-containing protein [Brevibacillus ruminantium]|uniref:Rhodanese-like domain-containing protein n=1 Tax=Brevibacillus ruminantium TaxID=2950604 RepID=A0ABY4WII0_9BACL|nr:rhodanese-like domain-containing protein [Brevibacillus ruminantium]USG66684.1 rhodanese-like domain-containing protein [Brevibacillus ruminantium]